MAGRSAGILLVGAAGLGVAPPCETPPADHPADVAESQYNNNAQLTAVMMLGF